MGGRQLGGEGRFPAVGVFKGQKGRVEGNLGAFVSGGLQGGAGNLPAVPGVVEEHFPGGSGAGGGGNLRLRQAAQGLRLRPAEKAQKQPLAKGPAGGHGLRRRGEGGGGRQALEAGLRKVEGVQ